MREVLSNQKQFVLSQEDLTKQMRLLASKNRSKREKRRKEQEEEDGRRRGNNEDGRHDEKEGEEESGGEKEEEGKRTSESSKENEHHSSRAGWEYWKGKDRDGEGGCGSAGGGSNGYNGNGRSNRGGMGSNGSGGGSGSGSNFNRYNGKNGVNGNSWTKEGGFLASILLALTHSIECFKHEKELHDLESIAAEKEVLLSEKRLFLKWMTEKDEELQNALEVNHSLKKKIERLSDECVVIDELMDQLSETKNDKDALIAALESQTCSHASAIHELQMALKQSEEKTSLLMSENSGLKEQVTELEAENKEMEDVIDEVCRSEEKHKSLEGIEVVGSSSATGSQMGSLTEDEDSSSSCSSYSELRKQQEENELLRSENELLQETVDELRHSLDVVKEDLTKLTQMKSVVATEKQSLSEDLYKMKRDNESLNKSKTTLQGQIEAVMGDLTQTKCAMTTEKKSLLKDLCKMKRDNESLNKSIAILQDQIDAVKENPAQTKCAMTTEKQSLLKDLSQMKRDNESLNKSNAILQDQIDSFRQDKQRSPSQDSTPDATDTSFESISTQCDIDSSESLRLEKEELQRALEEQEHSMNELITSLKSAHTYSLQLVSDIRSEVGKLQEELPHELGISFDETVVSMHKEDDENESPRYGAVNNQASDILHQLRTVEDLKQQLVIALNTKNQAAMQCYGRHEVSAKKEERELNMMKIEAAIDQSVPNDNSGESGSTTKGETDTLDTPLGEEEFIGGSEAMLVSDIHLIERAKETNMTQSIQPFPKESIAGIIPDATNSAKVETAGIEEAKPLAITKPSNEQTSDDQTLQQLLAFAENAKKSTSNGKLNHELSRLTSSIESQLSEPKKGPACVSDDTVRETDPLKHNTSKTAGLRRLLRRKTGKN